jgi:hypothetical protein
VRNDVISIVKPFGVLTGSAAAQGSGAFYRMPPDTGRPRRWQPIVIFLYT